MNKIIIKSPCDTNSDEPYATLSITPENCNNGAICQEIETGSNIKTIYSYEDGTKSNIVKSTIGGTDSISFDYNDNPIRSSDNLYLERVYSFIHRGITYEINYYETHYQRDIYVVNPLSWVYIGAAEKVIESIKLN